MTFWASALPAPVGAADSGVIAGPVYVKDGDSLLVIRPGARPVEVRLAGVDAPELDQPCTPHDGRAAGAGPWLPGWGAGDWLARRLHGRAVVCHPVARDTLGRLVARCTVDGADVAALVVAAGWGFGRKAETDAARAAGRGLWATGTCAAPRKFRANSWRNRRKARP